jgi:hypothetical protein
MVQVDELLGRIDEIGGGYYRLLLLVGQSSHEISKALNALAELLGNEVTNLNARMAETLIEETLRLRQLKAPKTVAAIVEEAKHNVVLLDHVDVLFSPTMQIDPLAILKSVSRNKTVVSAWPGETDGVRLIHGQDWHPEYQSYQVDDFAVLSLEIGAAQKN